MNTDVLRSARCYGALSPTSEQVLHTKLHLPRNRVAGVRDAAEPGAPEIEIWQPEARRIRHVVHLGTKLQPASATHRQILEDRHVQTPLRGTMPLAPPNVAAPDLRRR